jgi:hypothetical protein
MHARGSTPLGGKAKVSKACRSLHSVDCGLLDAAAFCRKACKRPQCSLQGTTGNTTGIRNPMTSFNQAAYQQVNLSIICYPDRTDQH